MLISRQRRNTLNPHNHTPISCIKQTTDTFGHLQQTGSIRTYIYGCHPHLRRTRVCVRVLLFERFFGCDQRKRRTFDMLIFWNSYSAAFVN